VNLRDDSNVIDIGCNQSPAAARKRLERLARRRNAAWQYLMSSGVIERWFAESECRVLPKHRRAAP
jgi:hypothetical protein